MSSRVRRRPSPPSRAKRNVRWAAIALLAMSIAPSEAPDHAAPVDETAMAAETASPTELPWIAVEAELDALPE